MKTFAVRVNKAPYFLFSTRGTEIKIDFEKMKMESKNGTKSSITKVSEFQIFMMKYVPILLLLIVGGVFPYGMKEIYLWLSGGVIAFTVLSVFINHIKWFKLFVLASSALVWAYMLLNGGDAYNFERILLYSVEWLMVGFIGWEINSGRWSNYYSLDDFESNITIKNSKTKTPFLKIGSKSFLNIDTGFNYMKSYRMSGYYIFIGNEIMQDEAKNEDDN